MSPLNDLDNLYITRIIVMVGIIRTIEIATISIVVRLCVKSFS